MLYRVSFNASNASYSRCFTDRSEAEKFYNDLLRDGIYRNVSFQEGWSYRWPIGVTGASIKLFIAVLSAWRAKAIFFLRSWREEISSLQDHKKITSFHRRTKPWNILIRSHLWLIASGAQSLSTVWKSTYEESCTTAYSGYCSSFSWSGFLMEWSYTGCFSAINHRSRRFSLWHTAQE